MSSYHDLNMDWDCAYSLAKRIKYTLTNLGLDHIAQSGTILDIATGDGKLLTELSKLYPSARFYGLSWEDAAKRNNPEADIRGGLIENLPFEDSGITIATSFNIFDYAEESRSRLSGFDTGKVRIKESTFRLKELESEVYRVLKPDGLYIPMELKIGEYFSLENWKIFQERFEVLESHSPDIMLVFRKHGN